MLQLITEKSASVWHYTYNKCYKERNSVGNYGNCRLWNKSWALGTSNPSCSSPLSLHDQGFAQSTSIKMQRVMWARKHKNLLLGNLWKLKTVCVWRKYSSWLHWTLNDGAIYRGVFSLLIAFFWTVNFFTKQGFQPSFIWFSKMFIFASFLFIASSKLSHFSKQD